MTNKLNDAQIDAIKSKFATALTETLYPEDKDFREFLHTELLKMAADDGVTKFVVDLTDEIVRLAELMKQGPVQAAGLTAFITEGLELSEEHTDKEFSNYLLLADAAASLNETKLTTSGTTPTSIKVSSQLNVQHVTGDSPFALLWLNTVQAIILVGGEKEAAGIITFRDNGLYDLMYTSPDLAKVHALIGVMATDSVATFKMAELRAPREQYDASALTVEVFKVQDTVGTETYIQNISSGVSVEDATLAAGIESWAQSAGVDLDKYTLFIPALNDIRDHIKEHLAQIPEIKVDENGVLSNDDIEDVVFEEVVEPAGANETSIKKTEITTRGGRVIEYPKRDVDTDTVAAIYNGIDNIIVEDSRLLNIANTTGQNPRMSFSQLVVSRVNALHPLSDSDKTLAGYIANEVFDALLPHLDEIQLEYNASLKPNFIDSTPEKVQSIANENKLHARGLSALSEEKQQEIYKTIAERPSLSEVETEYDSEYTELVLDILNQIAPYEYNSEILTNGVLKNQLSWNIDEDGLAYRGQYIRNVLVEVYEKLSNKEVHVDAALVRELATTGSSSSLFSMDSDKLKDLTENLTIPRTYVVSGESVIMLVNRQVQEDTSDEVDERIVSLYSIVNKSHANNIVIVKTKLVDKEAHYTLSSTTTYSGVADIAEYVKSILI